MFEDHYSGLPTLACWKKRAREEDVARRSESVVSGISSMNSFDQQIIKSMPTTDAGWEVYSTREAATASWEVHERSSYHH